MKTIMKIWKKMKATLTCSTHTNMIYVSADEYNRFFYQPTDFRFYR